MYASCLSTGLAIYTLAYVYDLLTMMGALKFQNLKKEIIKVLNLIFTELSNKIYIDQPYLTYLSHK